jgi:hypothetical protein
MGDYEDHVQVDPDRPLTKQELEDSETAHERFTQLVTHIRRNSGMGHRCVGQHLPNTGVGCTCPPSEPEPLTVYVLLDRVPYEGDTVIGVFFFEKDAWVHAGVHIDVFYGTPKILERQVQGEPE